MVAATVFLVVSMIIMSMDFLLGDEMGKELRKYIQEYMRNWLKSKLNIGEEETKEQGNDDEGEA